MAARIGSPAWQRARWLRSSELDSWAPTGWSAIHPHHSLVLAALVAEAHAAGMGVVMEEGA